MGWTASSYNCWNKYNYINSLKSTPPILKCSTFSYNYKVRQKGTSAPCFIVSCLMTSLLYAWESGFMRLDSFSYHKWKKSVVAHWWGKNTFNNARKCNSSLKHWASICKSVIALWLAEQVWKCSSSLIGWTSVEV